MVLSSPKATRSLGQIKMVNRSSLTSLLALAAVAGCSLAGCSGGDKTSDASAGGTTGGSTAASGKALTIAVIPKGSTHSYWLGVHEGANTAAAELKGVTIDWQPPVREDDKDAQIQIMETAINKNDDGIVLAPLDRKALVTPVNEAVKAKIPVAIIDSDLDGTGFISFIATDNYKGGQMDADEMAKLLNGKGDIVVLRYEVGSASTEAREKGFLDEIAKTPGIKVVSENQHGGATVDSAQSASESLLSTHVKGGSLDIQGIYCPNESTTFGMLRTLESLKVAGKVKFVGFDANDSLLAAMKKGEIDALVVQNPRKMGYLGVKTVVDFLRGNTKVDAKVDTGATLLTKDNLDQPDIAKLIAPPKA
jgi:ribose transport system substrate-binding protein